MDRTRSLSERLKNIQSFIAMDVMREANALEKSRADGVMHLEVGQPGHGAPRRVIEAAQKALEADRLGYTEALGLARLREEIATHYAHKYGVTIDKNRVLITTGSSAGFIVSFLTCFNETDEVLLPTPGYPAYRNILHGLGIKTRNIYPTIQHRYMPSADEICTLAQENKALKGLLLASPNNPSGTMVDEMHFKTIAETCDEEGLWLISDEIYHGLTYGRDEVSALNFSDKAIIINSFSKYYCMTGWRVGWMIVPEDLVGACEKLLQNFFISPPTLSQLAALEAFSCQDELEARRQGYMRNREILCTELPDMGLKDFMPLDGAFYAYVDVSKHTSNSEKWTRQVLEQAGIALTPGTDFDPEFGGHYVRMSYAGTQADIIEAMSRLKNYLTTR